MIKRNLIVTLMAMITLLQADNVVKYNMNGEVIEFMYKNPTTFKMVTNTEDGKVEIYHINKKSYVVSYASEGITVVDVNAMKAKAKLTGFDPSSVIQKQEKPKFTIKKTAKTVNVGGIRGSEWLVISKVNAKDYETKVVVTNDTDVVKTMRSMSDTMMLGTNLFEIEMGYVIIKADGMKLESFKSKNVPSKEYKLPQVTNVGETFKERNKRDKSDEIAKRENDSGISSEDVDNAVNLLKSLF